MGEKAQSLRLLILHGRKSPDENLDDWGPDGPTVYGIDAIHWTYGNANVFFESEEAAEIAQRLTGWETFDEKALSMRFHGDLLVVNGMYYGDWEIQTYDVDDVDPFKFDRDLNQMEGWDIFTVDGTTQSIQRCDELAAFDGDDDARLFVARQALIDNSERHLRTLRHIRDNNPTEFDAIMRLLIE